MTTQRIATLVRTLADGQWHQLDDAAAARETLAAIDLPLEIDSRGRARLDTPLDLLDAQRIRALLAEPVAGAVDRIDVHMTIDSTNDALRRQPPPQPGKADVCLAEFQQAGRGRRGRRWIAALGQALCLSVAWRYRAAPRQLGALGLAVGVGVAEALRGAGVEGVAVKWPNDLLCGDRKLGGLLIDAHGAGGDVSAVVGCGLNVQLDPMQRARLDGRDALTPTSLACIGAALATDRNTLAALVISSTVAVLERFGNEGLAPWAGRWQELDTLTGRVVEVRAPGGAFAGRALGVDEDGALLVDHDDRVTRVLAADVSVRPR